MLSDTTCTSPDTIHEEACHQNAATPAGMQPVLQSWWVTVKAVSLLAADEQPIIPQSPRYLSSDTKSLFHSKEA